MYTHTVLCLLADDVYSLLAVGARADYLLLVLTHTVITCLFLVLLARAVCLLVILTCLLAYSVLYLVAVGARLLLVSILRF
jgi:hypothetical protein